MGDDKWVTDYIKERPECRDEMEPSVAKDVAQGDRDEVGLRVEEIQDEVQDKMRSNVENKRLDEMSPSVADNAERRQSVTQGMGVEDISLSAQDEMSPRVADELDGGQSVNPSVAQEEWDEMSPSVETEEDVPPENS